MRGETCDLCTTKPERPIRIETLCPRHCEQYVAMLLTTYRVLEDLTDAKTVIEDRR